MMGKLRLRQVLILILAVHSCWCSSKGLEFEGEDDDLRGNARASKSEAQNIKSKDLKRETPVTLKEFDDAAAALFPLGDANRKLPATKSAMNKWCKLREKREEIVEEYIGQRLKEAGMPVGAGISSLIISSFKIRNAKYCANQTTIKTFVKRAKNVNNVTKILSKIRYEWVNMMIEESKTDDLYQQAAVCCGYYRYLTFSLAAVLTVTGKKPLTRWVEIMIESLHVDLIQAICIKHKKNSTTCRREYEEKLAKKNATERYKKPDVQSLQAPVLEIYVHDYSIFSQAKSLLNSIQVGNAGSDVFRALGDLTQDGQGDFTDSLKQGVDGIYSVVQDPREQLGAVDSLFKLVG